MKIHRPSYLKKALIIAGSAVVLCSVAAMTAVYVLTFHPKAVQGEHVYNEADTPILTPGQELKIMSWNVQYMAGKNYVFFYDVADGKGPDSQPSAQDVALTFNEVARIIKEDNPDVILLQEVDSGAKRTYYEDQLSVLMRLLPSDYKSYCSTYYWKNAFNPHPKVMGSTGVTLAIISKYKIAEATRHQLPSVEWSSIFKDFSFKRAVLKARMPVHGGKDFFAINTHLSAFSQGTDNMKRQISAVMSLLDPLEYNEYAWALGGDFNLLPPGQYEALGNNEKFYYQPETELLPLMQKYPSVPQLADCQGHECSKWFTHFSNDPQSIEPDRTLDYIFHSKHLGSPIQYMVRNADTLHISDHFPVITTFKMPE